MHVVVDENECQGHTLCNMVAPDVFKLREEDGHAYVEGAVVPPELELAVRKAALGCPEHAIRIID
jgi:ferredoxin